MTSIWYNFSMITVVTSGKKYLDIDAFAGIIACRELLKTEPNNAVFAISTAPLNQSIPPAMRKYKYKLDSQENLVNDLEYIVVDVSNPEFFDPIIEPQKIVKIIDHHTGYEKYWQEKLGKAAEIEFIGSVCTMIYEKIKAAEKEEILDQELCKLLTAGILDNTLNLKSSITTERDKKAYTELAMIGGLDESWRQEYFGLCFTEIEKNLEQAVIGDTKIEFVSENLPEVFGQIVLPSHSNFDTQVLQKAFAKYDEWMMNVISLDDGKSYIYFGGNDSKETKKKLEKLFQNSGQDNLIVLDKFKLRKEIMDRARKL